MKCTSPRFKCVLYMTSFQRGQYGMEVRGGVTFSEETDTLLEPDGPGQHEQWQVWLTECIL